MEEIEVADYLYLARFGAAYLEDIGAVVVSDIHLGYEEVRAKNGIFLPRVQSDIIYNTVEEIMDKCNPCEFITSGDLKHEFSKNTPQEWQDVYKLAEIISKRSEAIVVKGNHDNSVANIASKARAHARLVGSQPGKQERQIIVGNRSHAGGNQARDGIRRAGAQIGATAGSQRDGDKC
jgi:Predicted ICC-like phosphoesterases